MHALEENLDTQTDLVNTLQDLETAIANRELGQGDVLYSLGEKVYESKDEGIQQDYTYLQVSDHFYYMSTKFFSDGEVHSYFNPYDTPYDAFINYMNVLSDFEIRVNAAVRSSVSDDVARLSKIIKEKDEQLEKLESRLATKKATLTKQTATTIKSTAPKKTDSSKSRSTGKKS